MADEPKVAILMGSESDLPVVEAAVEMMEHFQVPFELHVMSAHRCPDRLKEFARGAESKGLEAILAAAGGAAHLAGVVASLTTLPVIGIPIPTDRMGGMDSLFSTLQMPSGIPVATVGLGKSGARNAAVLAVQILARQDEDLMAELRRYKDEMSDHVDNQEKRVRDWLERRQVD